MSELWTDERIIDALQVNATRLNSTQFVEYGYAFAVTSTVRDDLQARIAERDYQAIQTLALAMGYPVVEGSKDNAIDVGEHTLASIVDEIATEYARLLQQSLADNDEIVRLTNAFDAQLAATTRWEPVEIVEPDPDGDIAVVTFEWVMDNETVGLFRRVAGEDGNE